MSNQILSSIIRSHLHHYSPVVTCLRFALFFCPIKVSSASQQCWAISQIHTKINLLSNCVVYCIALSLVELANLMQQYLQRSYSNYRYQLNKGQVWWWIYHDCYCRWGWCRLAEDVRIVLVRRNRSWGWWLIFTMRWWVDAWVHQYHCHMMSDWN